MKKGITTDIDWGYIGASLANEGDNEQAEFLKAFVKECGAWGTSHQVQMQLAGVNRKLTDAEKEVLSMLSYSEESQ